jgi:hypothetical protein
MANSKRCEQARACKPGAAGDLPGCHNHGVTHPPVDVRDRLALVLLVKLIGAPTGVGWFAAMILAFGPRRLPSAPLAARVAAIPSEAWLSGRQEARRAHIYAPPWHTRSRSFDLCSGHRAAFSVILVGNQIE